MDIMEQYPSKYLTAADLKGKEYTLEILGVAMEEVSNGELKPIMQLKGADKGLVVNKTNATNLAYMFGPETGQWTGQKVVLFATATTTPNGQPTMGLRVRAPTAVAPADMKPIGAVLPDVPPSSTLPAGAPPSEQQAQDLTNDTFGGPGNLDDEIPFAPEWR